MPSDGPMCILDPCAGEGVAIAEAAHALGREQTKAFAVEFDARARHARGLVDHCLHADLMDTMVSSGRSGCSGSTRRMATCPGRRQTSAIKVRDVARLEKLFYQRSLSLLQYGGVLAFIVPGHVLDAELVGWLTRHSHGPAHLPSGGDAVQQVVIFGRRCAIGWRRWQAVRNLLLQIEASAKSNEELPSDWPFLPYIVQASPAGREYSARRWSRNSSPMKWPAARPLAVAGRTWGPQQRSLRPPARALSTGISPWLWPRVRLGVVRSEDRARARRQGDTQRTRRSSGNSPNGKTAPSPRPASSPTVCSRHPRAWDMTPGPRTGRGADHPANPRTP